MPKNIPTSDEWKKTRAEVFKIPENVGPSFGKLLADYHTKKKKGTKSALKALLAVQKVAKSWPDTAKVRNYIVDHRLEAEEALMDKYFAELNTKINTRIAKLRRYEQIIGNAKSLTLEDVFMSSKLRAAFSRAAHQLFSGENFNFIEEYQALKFNPNQGMATQVAKAMAIINKYQMDSTSGDLNISPAAAGAIKNVKDQEKAILAEVNNKEKAVLWKQLCEALRACYDEIWIVMQKDTLSKFISFKVDVTALAKPHAEFMAVLAKMKGVDKWDK